MNKRDLLTKVFNNQKAERVPVGFWFHFTENEILDGFKNPEMFQANIEGEKKFYEEFQPDFIKIMTDGFFMYPREAFTNAQSISHLKKLDPIGESHPWIEKQVEYAKKLTSLFGAELFSFYNIFAPATLFRFGHYNHNKDQDADSLLADLILEDAGTVARAFDIVAQDTACLAKRVIQEAKVSGIYYSTQDPHDTRINEQARKALFVPGDMTILSAANTVSQYNILHICGYAGYKNNLSHFVDYPASIINWASHVEKISLSEGKKLFKGKPVIGGFANTADALLYTGSKAEIEAETERLIKEAGSTGLVLGADCTVPKDIDIRHLEWVREKAARIGADF
ncbi:MAG: uroporphyrinogen decarboxylase [Spirochaetaceae bacterium]|jgi:uroporphyrinogen decarboxylase|nr:uroporphyrinogen decarboxylase [Spirochaetaceae bacterium]